MELKAKKTSLKYAFLALLIAIIGIVSLFSFYQTKNTFAESGSVIPTISDSNFSFKIDARHRINQRIYYDSKDVKTTTNENVTYYTYLWSQLKYLTLSITPTLDSSQDVIQSCTLSVSNKQTEDLTSTSEMKTKTLFSTVIASNKMNRRDITYYIDSDSDFSETETKKIGNDYGIYKFDFNYTYIKDGISHNKNLATIYIAVIPDSIDDISINNLKINYSVASSNKLMNIFNLTLNRASAFAYVNPTYIQWKVVGKDVNNISYALNDEVKNSKTEYFNYRIIWNATQQIQTTGTYFVFDSNDIEGTWTAYCTILNSDGTERTTIKSEELSTVKVERKSYTLMIILIVMGVVLVGSIVGLIIYVNKKKKTI